MKEKKKRFNVTRVIAFLLAILLSIMPLSVNANAAILSQPAVNATGTILSSSLRVRNWPSTSSNSGIIGTIYSGETVTVLQLFDTDQSDYSLWYKILSKAGTGYVAACFVKTSGSSGWASYTIDSYRKSGVVTASSLSLRSGPGTGYGTIANLSKGTTVNSVERIDTHASSNRYWLKVNCSSGSGYVSEQYVSFGGTSSSNNSQQTTTSVPALSGQGTITASSLNVRQAPGSTVIASLRYGTVVNLLGETADGWLKIQRGNTVGFVAKQYINITQMSSGNKRYTWTGNVRFRSSASDATSDNVITNLDKGETLTYDGVMQNGFAHVYYKGTWGWVYAKYLTNTTWNLATTASTTLFGNTGRVHNIKLACQMLNTYTVAPGKTFSWKDIMGPCDKSQGFELASVIENSIEAKGYGGGVCQVSTTINMAIKKLGIQTQTVKHSVPSSYAAREDEATVSYPNKNFSFTNTLGKSIRLELSTYNGKCTCKVYVAS